MAWEVWLTFFGAAIAMLTSMRPSALARLGLAEPQRAHPRLSLIEIVGHDGNRAETPGHDLNYQAAQGTLSPPAMPLVPLADVLGAERAVSTATLRSPSPTATTVCTVSIRGSMAASCDANDMSTITTRSSAS